MLILAGHDERRFSLQINITKDITSMVQWVKAFSMTSFLCILLLVITIGYYYWLLLLVIAIGYCILIAL